MFGFYFLKNSFKNAIVSFIAPIAVESSRFFIGTWNEKREYGLLIMPKPFATNFNLNF